MSTRGLWGFVIDGEEKLTYNHWDSYPSGLGSAVLKWLKIATDSVPALREAARRVRLVDQDAMATEEDVARFRNLADTGVSTGSLTEWYVLLRDLQGDMAAIVNAGVMIDNRAFAADSLFCEWAYVIDLDTERFEVYKGFQHEPHSEGRFAAMPHEQSHRGESQYYPVRLVGAWSLTDLPDDATFVATVDPPEED